MWNELKQQLPQREANQAQPKAKTTFWKLPNWSFSFLKIPMLITASAAAVLVVVLLYPGSQPKTVVATKSEDTGRTPSDSELRSPISKRAESRDAQEASPFGLPPTESTDTKLSESVGKQEVAPKPVIALSSEDWSHATVAVKLMSPRSTAAQKEPEPEKNLMLMREGGPTAARSAAGLPNQGLVSISAVPTAPKAPKENLPKKSAAATQKAPGVAPGSSASSAAAGGQGTAAVSAVPTWPSIPRGSVPTKSAPPDSTKIAGEPGVTTRVFPKPTVAPIILIGERSVRFNQEKIDSLYRSIQPTETQKNRFEFVSPQRLRELINEGKIKTGNTQELVDGLRTQLNVAKANLITILPKADKFDIKSELIDVGTGKVVQQKAEAGVSEEQLPLTLRDVSRFFD
jgi:hypothetical protein